MLFFNPFFLARQLRDNTLNEDSRFRLVMAVILFQGMERLLEILTGSTTSPSRNLSLIVGWCISAIGVYLAYRTNVRGDNRRFLERLFCLYVPLLLWLRLVPSAFDVLLYRAIIAHYGLSASIVLRSITPFLQVWVWVRYVFYYVALNFLIRIAASGGPTRNIEDSSILPAPIAAP